MNKDVLDEIYVNSQLSSWLDKAQNSTFVHDFSTETEKKQFLDFLLVLKQALENKVWWWVLHVGFAEFTFILFLFYS